MQNKSRQKISIVTGSTKGIGKGIARELAQQGMKVIVTSRNPEQAREVADEFNAAGYDTYGLRFNLEETDSLHSLIEETIDTFGSLDILVNNALSQSSVLPLDTLSDDQIGFAFTANITNTFLLSKLAHPHLKTTGGNIINIGSVAVNRHVLGLPLYSIIKGAIQQMTRVLAAEWASDGIRVNGINPGFIYTSALSSFSIPDDVIKKQYEFYKKYHALGRIGEPDEIGKVAAYLASDNAGFVTGSTIDIDGGYSIQGLPMFQAG